MSTGAQEISPPANAGFVAGYALIAVAALTPAREAPRWTVRPGGARWGHLLLPYVPVAGTGVLLIVQLARGTQTDSVESSSRPWSSRC